MNEPMVSIFWLNYNSSSFIDVALESLQGVMNLDYSNYELVVVDNCSTDRSLHTIRSFIERNMSGMHVKVIRLRRNIGFTGGNNVAYRARNKDSKYVVFLNNDAVPFSDSLKKLVDFMESDSSLGSVGGVALRYDGRTIECAGNYISELLTTYSLYNLPPKASRRIRYITFADGAYSVNRVSSIKKAVGRDDLIFDDCMFAYYDDNVLGLKMWNANFKVASCPVITARHKGSSSFGRIRPFQVYLEARGLATLNEISNSKYKKLIKPLLIDVAYANSMLDILGSIAGRNIGPSISLSAALLRGFQEGVRIGRAKRALGETIDIYKAPIIRLNLANSFPICLRPWVRLSWRVVRKLNSLIVQES